MSGRLPVLAYAANVRPMHLSAIDKQKREEKNYD